MKKIAQMKYISWVNSLIGISNNNEEKDINNLYTYF